MEIYTLLSEYKYSILLGIIVIAIIYYLFFYTKHKRLVIPYGVPIQQAPKLTEEQRANAVPITTLEQGNISFSPQNK